MMRSINILLIDDNLADAELTRDTLIHGRLCPAVATAGNGVEALELLQDALHCCTQLPDLIVLDVNMPRLDGPGLLVELNKQERLRAIPVVMFASSDDAGDIATSYRLGASYYLTKPLGFSEFQESVRAVEDFWLSMSGQD